MNSASNSVTDFDYTEDNLAFYVEARKKIKKFNFTAGIRFEDYKVDRKAIQDNAETKVNFKNSIIIMTSNTGSRQLKEFGTGVGFNTKNRESNHLSKDTYYQSCYT